MASGNILTYLAYGLAAARPAAPDNTAGVLAVYWATDTLVLSVWDGSTWTDQGGGGGGAVTSVNGQTGAVSLKLQDLVDVITSSGQPDDGAVLYYDVTASAWVELPPGSDGDVLTLASGIPSWAPGGGGGAVSSVNGQTGAVILGLSDLDNVVPATGAGFAAGMLLYFDGSVWTADDDLLYDTLERMIKAQRGSFGVGNPDANSIAGDDEHWFNITNDPSIEPGGLGSGKQFLRMNAYGATGYGNNVHPCRYRGTIAVPLPLQSADILFSLGLRGAYDNSGTTLLSASAASFHYETVEAWTGTARGIKAVWGMTPPGSTTRSTVMELDGKGRLTPKAMALDMIDLLDGSSIATDAGLANNFRVTLGGNRTLANPTNLTDGQVLNWKIKQDGTGTRTLAYGSKFKWPGGSAPTLSTAANAIDVISAVYDATDDILMAAIQKAFA